MSGIKYIIVSRIVSPFTNFVSFSFIVNLPTRTVVTPWSRACCKNTPTCATSVTKPSTRTRKMKRRSNGLNSWTSPLVKPDATRNISTRRIKYNPATIRIGHRVFCRFSFQGWFREECTLVLVFMIPCLKSIFKLIVYPTSPVSSLIAYKGKFIIHSSSR